jgi:hypothetical protein
MRALQNIRRLFRRAVSSAQESAEGGTAVATPPAGAASAEPGDTERETSTNAQVEGAADEPYPGNR